MNMNESPIPQYRLAVLIDGDNAQPSLLEAILTEANKYGLAIIRRIYGDWTSPQMNSWKEALNTHAIQPIQQFRYTTGKNATDSALIIDAMDILYTTNVEGFFLVSSDSDYTRLATRIREKGLRVVGVGKQTTPKAFIQACEIFIYVENLVENKTQTLNNAATKHLIELSKTAFEQVVREDGWASLAEFGASLRKIDPSFDPRTYNHKQLSTLVEAHPKIFEIRRSKAKGASGIYIKMK